MEVFLSFFSLENGLLCPEYLCVISVKSLERFFDHGSKYFCLLTHLDPKINF